MPDFQKENKRILANLTKIANIDNIVINDMKDKLLNSPNNKINHYRIELNSYKV